MSKNSRFSGPFNKQHGKRAQTLLKSVSQRLYHILQSLPRKLSWKISFFLTGEILDLVLNTLAADQKYLVLHSDNLTILIQMELSQKQKTFSQFFLHFWNVDKILNFLKQKITLRAFAFPKLPTLKTWLDKRLKSTV